LVENKNEDEKEEKLKNEYYWILDDRRNIIYNQFKSLKKGTKKDMMNQ